MQNSRREKRKKQDQTQRRFNAIKDLMSTFAMSTVAVVAAVVLIPTSPKAEITKAVAMNEKIVYQVDVTDQDNALDLSTLFVALENQSESYEQHISLGENSGYFDNLNADTSYRLSVYGNKGFGQERLDTLMIKTQAKIGATILSVTPQTMDYYTNYVVDVSVYDPDSKYSSIDLYYGYSMEQYDQGMDTQPTDFQYFSIPITSSEMSIELSDIYTSEPFHIYIEGTSTDGTEQLDEIWVTPPFNLYTSVYTNYVNDDKIGFFLYSDMDVGTISYEMNIYKGESLLRTDPVVMDHSESEYEGSEFTIQNLTPNTTYTFECVATYSNPQTLREETQIIYSETLTTLNDYTIDYTSNSVDDYIEVTIVVTDPNNYFQNAYYETYDTSGEYNMYLDGQTYVLNDDGTTKSITFTIYKPTSASYQIKIGLNNDFDYSIREIIDTINFG